MCYLLLILLAMFEGEKMSSVALHDHHKESCFEFSFPWTEPGSIIISLDECKEDHPILVTEVNYIRGNFRGDSCVLGCCTADLIPRSVSAANFPGNTLETFQTQCNGKANCMVEVHPQKMDTQLEDLDCNSDSSDKEDWCWSRHVDVHYECDRDHIAAITAPQLSTPDATTTTLSTIKTITPAQTVEETTKVATSSTSGSFSVTTTYEDQKTTKQRSSDVSLTVPVQEGVSDSTNTPFVPSTQEDATTAWIKSETTMAAASPPSIRTMTERGATKSSEIGTTSQDTALLQSTLETDLSSELPQTHETLSNTYQDTNALSSSDTPITPTTFSNTTQDNNTLSSSTTTTTKENSFLSEPINTDTGKRDTLLIATIASLGGIATITAIIFIILYISRLTKKKPPDGQSSGVGGFDNVMEMQVENEDPEYAEPMDNPSALISTFVDQKVKGEENIYTEMDERQIGQALPTKPGLYEPLHGDKHNENTPYSVLY